MKKSLKLFGLLAVMMALYSCNNEPDYCGQYQYSGTAVITGDMQSTQPVSGTFRIKQGSGNTVIFCEGLDAQGKIEGNVITFEPQTVTNQATQQGVTIKQTATSTIDPITVGGSSLKIKQTSDVSQEMTDEYGTDKYSVHTVIEVTATKIK